MAKLTKEDFISSLKEMNLLENQRISRCNERRVWC